MLSKCANPACGAKFQYLHVGQLFAIEYRRCIHVHGSNARSGLNSDLVQAHDRLRYFWLCSACSKFMTIQAAKTGGVRLALTRASTYDGSQVAAMTASGEAWTVDPGQGWRDNMITTMGRLSALKNELEFLEAGGYRQALGWRPALVFEDSPVCPKPPCANCPNYQCALLEFVPDAQRAQNIPCQHIPLNETGETLYTMYRTATMGEIENALREWLRARIAEIEESLLSEPLQKKDDAA